MVCLHPARLSDEQFGTGSPSALPLEGQSWLRFHTSRKGANLRATFFLRCLRSPDSVGAVAPSLVFLAKALCRYARGAHHVIELGAGTGAVTKHLRDEFPVADLVVVERDATMAAALQRRFNTCTVVADAIQARNDLFKGNPEPLVTMLYLPFRSLPVTVAE